MAEMKYQRMHPYYKIKNNGFMKMLMENGLVLLGDPTDSLEEKL